MPKLLYLAMKNNGNQDQCVMGVCVHGTCVGCGTWIWSIVQKTSISLWAFMTTAAGQQYESDYGRGASPYGC